MKFLLKFISLLLCANLSLSELFCPKEREVPQEIQIDSSYTINPVKYSDKEYNAIQIANKIFLNQNTGNIGYSTNILTLNFVQ